MVELLETYDIVFYCCTALLIHMFSHFTWCFVRMFDTIMMTFVMQLTLITRRVSIKTSVS